MATKALALADQLQGVLDGVIALEDVLDAPGNQGEILQSCIHGLGHYLVDDGIRAKDAVYRQMQETELRRLIALLRSGADSRLLSKIHFLGKSEL